MDIGGCMSGVDVMSVERVKYKVKEPNLFNVVLLNDDKTTMEFVIEVLVSIYDKQIEEAVALMLHIHEKGSAIVGTYVEDIALTKSELTKRAAMANGFPLENRVQPA